LSINEYHRPRSLAQAVRLMEDHPEARFIAGGTDLMVSLRAGSERPPALISLGRVAELRGITNGDPTRIGALTTIAEILEHQELAQRFPLLREAALPFGSMQIRNLATLGGNLCNASPAADMAPALLVLGARVEMSGPSGDRELPLSEFFVGPGETRREPGEVLTTILLPPSPTGARHGFRRKGRVAMDLAIASVAVSVVTEGERCTHVRVAAGAVAPCPLRLVGAEDVLEGHAADAERMAQARARVEREVSPITDLRAGADYRRQLTGVLFQRALVSALNGSPA